jgi:hypothetical protein
MRSCRPARATRRTCVGILLLADHNTYHLGQIVAVRRAVGAWT